MRRRFRTLRRSPDARLKDETETTIVYREIALTDLEPDDLSGHLIGSHAQADWPGSLAFRFSVKKL
jgi:hypothetical protein